MDEHKDGFRRVISCRTARWIAAILVVILPLFTATAIAAGAVRHFDLAAGEAPRMLNEFSLQSGMQVLFDFNLLTGMKTRAVSGEFDVAEALTAMLKGTNLGFDFVNDHTLAVTPKKPSAFTNLWPRLKSRSTHGDDGLAQVLISGTGQNTGTQPLLGAEMINFGRLDIERSGLATTEDFLRTLPQVFGGGPTEDTVLGREAGTNSAHGSGINLRGLDAGATLVLIDGKRLAPSGTAGAFDNISNIPLSIIERIDILPDGASAQYGADAIGGVVNFVTRKNFNGLSTQGRYGGVTNGSMAERQFSQLLGQSRDTGQDFLSFEYFERDPLQARARAQYSNNLTALGGGNFEGLAGPGPGTLIAANQTFAIPERANGSAIASAALIPGTSNLYDKYRGSYVTPGEKRWSVFTQETQRLSDALQLQFEGFFSRRNVHELAANSFPLNMPVSSSNPYYLNPTGGNEVVTVAAGSTAYFGLPFAENRVDNGNFSMGLSISPWQQWTAGATVGYSFETNRGIQHGAVNQLALDAALNGKTTATAFDPFGDAASNNTAVLNSIGGDSSARSESTLKTANLSAAGPLLSLSGGDVALSVGLEYRLQGFNLKSAAPHGPIVDSGVLTRNVKSEFIELRVPIIGKRNDVRFVRSLEVSLGGRHENSSDVGSASVPKLGLLWAISRDWSVRTSWTKAFKPPNLTDLLVSTSQSGIAHFTDPAAPNSRIPVLGLFGTNPTLHPETARSWTLGTDFTVPALQDLRVSFTYFDIQYSNRITYAQFTPDALLQPNLAWLFTKNATPTQLATACRQTQFIQGTTDDCIESGVNIIVDDRLRNIALLQTNGFDLIGKYSMGSPVGRFDFGLNATYLFRYAQSNTPTSPLDNIVSTQNNPINLRARGSVAWEQRGFGAAGFVNFENSYRDTVSVPNRGVSPWTTLDLQLSYQTPAEAMGWFGNAQIALNVQNVFNVNPPFLNNSTVGIGYDQENADLYGRIVSVEVRKRW